jgi:hypothetical protein
MHARAGELEHQVERLQGELDAALGQELDRARVEAREQGKEAGKREAEQTWKDTLSAAVAERENVIVAQAQECQSLRALLSAQREGQAAWAQEQASSEAALMRLHRDLAAKDKELDALNAQVRCCMEQLEAARQQAAAGHALATQQAEALEDLSGVPAQLIATLQHVILRIKQQREATDQLQRIKWLTMSNQTVALEEALSQSQTMLHEAEEYSGQLEQRLEAALEWRQTVEAEVEQQYGREEVLNKQLAALKAALDMSPSATPSKGVAKVRRLQNEVQSALERVQAEAMTCEQERFKRTKAEGDVDVLKRDLTKMQLHLQQQQQVQQVELAKMATERAEAHELREVLEAQIGQMQQRVMGLQKAIDNYQTNESAREQAVEALVRDRDDMLMNADCSIANLRAHLQKVLQDKQANDAQAEQMQEHLDSVNTLLSQENMRVRSSIEHAQRLEQENRDLTTKLTSLQVRPLACTHLTCVWAQE